VRVLAVLIVLGLLAGTGDARAVDTPVTVMALSVDEIDEGAEVALLVPVVTPIDESHGLDALIQSALPPHYDHCLFVFRPPRAYAN
jgi:hypothetical protein